MRLASAASLALCLVFALAPWRAAAEPTYTLAVSIDPAGARLSGVATIDGAAGDELVVDPGPLRVTAVSRNGVPVFDGPTDEVFSLPARARIRIEFEGLFAAPGGDLIDSEQVVLRRFWYPIARGDFHYALTVEIPGEFHVESEAEEVVRTESGDTALYAFRFPHALRPQDGITLVASRNWISTRTQHGDIDLSIHVLRDRASRLPALQAQARRYLADLERLLGPYPYRRLAIVENPLAMPYSLSMPTYVLLSQQSVRSASGGMLNHELAHAWFGNGVFVDYASGNWCEGLANYFSDHLASERSGAAWALRQRMLADYQRHAAAGGIQPLRRFAMSADVAANVVGYTKAELVVHMLRRLVGDAAFFAAVRRFVADNMMAVASWDHLRIAFERETGADLRWFFEQWLKAQGAPDLAIEGAAVRGQGDRYELTFALAQREQVFSLTVPLTVYFEDGGRDERRLELRGANQRFRYVLPRRPVRIVLDENYDLVRRLAPDEIPLSAGGAAGLSMRAAAGSDARQRDTEAPGVAHAGASAARQRGVVAELETLRAKSPGAVLY